MAYCTVDDIKKIAPESDLVELTDDSDSGEIDTGIIEECISDAAVIIDGYIGARYALPLSPIPPLLKTICRDMAIYDLYSRRMKLKPSETLKDRNDNALKLLLAIQKGTLKLGADSGSSEAAPSSGGGTRFIAKDRIFSRKSMENF